MLILTMNSVQTLDKDTSECLGTKCTVNGFDKNDTTSDIIRICNCQIVTDISFCKSIIIDEIPNEFFQFTQLHGFEVCNMHLKSIENLKNMSSATNLINLALRNVSLTKLTENLFQHFSDLKYLNLGENDLTELKENTFNGLALLEHLSLTGNKISKLHGNVFHSLHSLLKIDLNNNLISIIDADLFSKNNFLQQIDFTSNTITVIAPQSFSQLPNLYVLNIENNLLEQIDLSHLNITCKVRISNSKLKFLSIPNNIAAIYAFQNKIQRITVTSENSSLQALYLAKNQLKSIDEVRKLKNLTHLDLSYNGDLSIDFHSFININKLEQLILYNTSISNLNAITLQTYCPKLKILGLSANAISENDLNQIFDLKVITILDEQSRIVNHAMTRDGKKIQSDVRSGQQQSQSTPQTSIIEPVPNRQIDAFDKQQQQQQIECNRKVEQLQNDIYKTKFDEYSKIELEHTVHNLRVWLITTIIAFSIFVTIQILPFVRNNYSRFRTRTHSFFRTTSHDPMLEDTL